MRRVRHIGWIGAVLLVLAGCVRGGDNSVSMDTVRAEGEPDQESWGARFVVSEVPPEGEASRPRMIIVADYLAEYTRGDSTYMLLRGRPLQPDEPDSLSHRVLVHLFDAEGDSSATLTADRVFYFEEEQRFEARGDVVVITREDRRLESEHLLWFEDERKVRTPGFVRIIMPDERVQGYGLEADENLDTYQLERVTAQVVLEDEE